MHCCEPTIVPFSNVERTNVTYTTALRSKHGDVPMVDVLYFNSDTEEFDFSNLSSKVELQGSPVSNIYVEHGGRFTGVIKIL